MTSSSPCGAQPGRPEPRRFRGRRGSATLELALLIPVFAFLLFGMVDWGLAMEQRLQLQTAARAGAQVAMRNPQATADIAAAARAAAPGFAALDVVTRPVWCECGGVEMQTCSEPCRTPVERFVRVEVSHPYSRITPTGPTRISARVELRLN